MLAIETRGLRKLYGQKVAVADLSIKIEEGEVFGFLGPNGAGKSTTVKMLVGLIKPSAGEGFLLGAPLGDIASKRRLGFLPEQFRFHEWLRADEFLDFHGRLAGLDAGTRQKRIPEALELVGLLDRQTDKLHSFSKGMLQRIGIAQAIIGDPDIIVLDEPTSALDPIGRRDVRDLIHHLKSLGKTVFLNSHLLSEVEMVCDRVAIVNYGKVLTQGKLRDLLGERELDLQVDSVSDELKESLSSRWRIVRQFGGSLTLAISSEEEANEVARLVIDSGAKLYSLTPSRRSLEDLFVETLGEGEERSSKPAEPARKEEPAAVEPGPRSV